MGFDILIALDLQVTNPVASKVDEGGVQEVIEFPWVIIDVASKSIVESKVVYLKPEHCPELGDRCKAITGLDDETLAAGCSLQECVQELNDYLYKQVTSQNKDFCFVTDGDTSLKRWLRSDAKVKKVKLAAHYQKFIDLRAEFKAKYPKWAGVDSGPSMASRLGIELEPSVDGGLRLCNALAAVAVQLLEDGAPFTKTVSISDDYDALADPLFVKGGPRYHEPLRAKCVQGDAMPESKVVKCRGMPYSAQKHDLEAFFGTCRIADVWIVLNQFGRATGEAYVTFETSLDALRATHRCRDLMNQRYVEVFASTQAEADATRASMAAGATISGIGAVGGTDDMQFGGVCKLRGLPYTCSYDDIKRFFDGIPIKKDGITLCENREGRNNGEAYVEFEVEQGATEASKRDRMSLGSRYVEVYKCTKADLATYLSNRAQMHASLLGMSAGGVPTGPEYFIKVRGLPFTAREPEVVAFFAKAGVVPQGVSLVYNSRDQPNGECYVELASADDLSRGLTLHRDTMGHRYVELFRTTRTEAMQALRLPQPAAAAAAAAQAYMNPYGQAHMYDYGAAAYAAAYGMAAPAAYGMPISSSAAVQGVAGVPGVSGAGGGGGAMPAMPTTGLVKIRGLPYRVTAMDIATFFHGFSFHPEMIQIAMGGDGRPNGEAYCTFVSPEEAQRAIYMKNRQHIGNRYVEIFPA